MPRNIEIKVRIKDPGAIMERVSTMADGRPVELKQDDTYFATGAGSGALKLRVLSPTEGNLVCYSWRDTVEPGIRMSHWFLYETGEPAVLGGLLERSLGCRGRVTKQRLLYHSGNVRIHIDDVQDLGWFLELEAVLSPEDPEEVGVSQVLDLLGKLGISAKESIAEGYQLEPLTEYVDKEWHRYRFSAEMTVEVMKRIPGFSPRLVLTTVLDEAIDSIRNHGSLAYDAICLVEACRDVASIPALQSLIQQIGTDEKEELLREAAQKALATLRACADDRSPSDGSGNTGTD